MIERNTYTLRAVAFLLILGMILISGERVRAEEENMSFVLKSGAFDDGGKIPPRYTCDGRDIAPPLNWKGVPGTARSLVLIVDDPDAPDPKAPKMTWVHWVLYNIPPHTRNLPGGTGGGVLPPATGEGLNGWHRTGYGGPCPPIGRHRYFFKLYALDKALDFGTNPVKADVVSAMHGHVITWTWLMGTYRKQQ